MSTENAEKQASSAWGSEERRVESQADANSESGASTASETDGTLPIGTAGANWAGSIVGGILSRMIAEKRSRIREVDECLEWYEREKVQRTEELVELEQLAAQIRTDE
jgi:hypothetical protein